ncbi:MAG: hypothetical protein JO282_07225 [Alphaproteobacteria bacterium]|nr:hypothetical protein [Alphaproteobacteria bacterium]
MAKPDPDRSGASPAEPYSGRLARGGAIMPVPYGMIIDTGRPELVLAVVAALLLLSLLCAGGARVGFRRVPVPVAAE